MSKASMKKLTLADLMARKEQGAADKLAFMQIDVPSLGGALEFKKLPLARVLDMIDASGDNPSTKESFQFSCELVYRHCPVLQSAELREAYECAEPYDIVPAVFDENLGLISELAEQLLGFYGLTDAKDQVKN